MALIGGVNGVPVGFAETPPQMLKVAIPVAEACTRGLIEIPRSSMFFPDDSGFITASIGTPPAPPVKAVGATAVAFRNHTFPRLTASA